MTRWQHTGFHKRTLPPEKAAPGSVRRFKGKPTLEKQERRKMQRPQTIQILPALISLAMWSA